MARLNGVVAVLSRKREPVGTVLEVDAPETQRPWGWTPSGVEVAADHLVIGDRACQVREVAAWPAVLAPGAMPDATLAGEAALVIGLAPVPAERVNAALDKALPRQQSAAREAQRKGSVDAEQERKIRDALALKEAIASGMVRHFDAHVSLLYWADGAEAAVEAARAAQRRARERTLELVALRHSQGPSYHGALPGGRPVLRGLLLDQSQASALFPFTDENLLDPGGVFAGINERTGAPVLWNRWLPDVSHLLVSGDTGYGKSFVVKVLLTQERVFGRPLLVLDPSPKREYAPLLEALGGRYIALQPSGTQRLNPLEVMPDGAALAEGHAPEQHTGRPVSDRIAAVKPIFAALCGESLDSGPFDAVLEAALQRAYRQAGCTDSWDGCFTGAVDALGSLAWRPKTAWPTLGDVRRALEASEDAEGPRYARMLAPYCQGGSSDLLDGQTTVTLDSPVVGLGVNDLIAAGGRFARAGYAAVVDYAAQRFRALAAPHKVLCVDEAHNFLRDPVMAPWLERQTREARKAGISMTIISQGVADFLRNDTGRAIWQNTRCKLYLHQPAGDLSEAAAQLGLDPQMLGEAAALPRGHALLQVAERVVAVAVQAPDTLQPMLRSDVAAQPRGDA